MTDKVLITGGAGFIGLFLAKKLMSKYRVDLIDNFYRGKKDYTFNSILKEKNVNLYKIDLLEDRKKFNKLSKNYKYIFHLAAIVGVKNVINNSNDVLIKNIILLKNTIEIAKKQKNLKRFIFFSTSEVYYGTLKNYGLKFPTKENTKLSILHLSNKRGTYMLSKIYGEAMCAHSNLPFTVIRPHNFYGPRMGLAHVIPELFKKAYFAKNNKITVYSPNHKRNFCYIEDGINLILSLIFKKETLGKTYNVGSNNKDINIERLAKIIIKISQKKLKIKKEKDLFDSPIRRFPDVSKALKITSFKYKHDLELGLKKTFDWYKTNIFKK